MSPPRRPRALAFQDTKVVCPRCPGLTLQYYGKPDWIAFVRDGKPVRFWCPKCKSKFDATVKIGTTPEEDERSLNQVEK